MTGVRVLSGPNLYDDSGGVVIGTDARSLRRPARLALSRTTHLRSVAIPGLADEWTATAARVRAALRPFGPAGDGSGDERVDFSGRADRASTLPRSRLAVFIRLRARDHRRHRLGLRLQGVHGLPGYRRVGFSKRRCRIPQRGASIRRDITTAALGPRGPPARPAPGTG